jgi:hypothetical protein
MIIEWLAGDKADLHPKMSCEKVTVHTVKNYLQLDGTRSTRVLLVVHFNEEHTAQIKRDFPGLYKAMGMFPVYIAPIDRPGEPIWTWTIEERPDLTERYFAFNLLEGTAS